MPLVEGRPPETYGRSIVEADVSTLPETRLGKRLMKCGQTRTISEFEFHDLCIELQSILNTGIHWPIYPYTRLGKACFNKIQCRTNVMQFWFEEDTLLLKEDVANSLLDKGIIRSIVPVLIATANQPVDRWVEIVPWRYSGVEVVAHLPQIISLPGDPWLRCTPEAEMSNLLRHLWPVGLIDESKWLTS